MLDPTTPQSCRLGQSTAETHTDQCKDASDSCGLACRCCWTLRLKVSNSAPYYCSDRPIPSGAADSPVQDRPLVDWYSMHENMRLIQRALQRVLQTREFERLRLHHSWWVYRRPSPSIGERDSASCKLQNPSAYCAERTLQNARFRRDGCKTKRISWRSDPDVLRN